MRNKKIKNEMSLLNKLKKIFTKKVDTIEQKDPIDTKICDFIDKYGEHPLVFLDIYLSYLEKFSDENKNDILNEE